MADPARASAPRARRQIARGGRGRRGDRSGDIRRGRGEARARAALGPPRHWRPSQGRRRGSRTPAREPPCPGPLGRPAPATPRPRCAISGLRNCLLSGKLLTRSRAFQLALRGGSGSFARADRSRARPGQCSAAGPEDPDGFPAPPFSLGGSWVRFAIAFAGASGRYADGRWDSASGVGGNLREEIEIRGMIRVDNF